MTMLQTLLSNVMSSAKVGARRGSGKGTDPMAKEERSAYRKLIENAVKEGNQQQIAALLGKAPKGVDPSIYATIAGMQTPEQKAKREVNNRIYGDFLTILNGGQPTSQQAVTPTPPSQEPTVAPAPQVVQPKPPVARPSALPAKLFTQDFIVRKVLKDLSGIDVGGHYLESEDWFKSYGEKTDSGIPPSQAVSDTAIEYGFIPSGASNLRDISEAERQVIFEGEFQTALDDPTVDALFRDLVPEGANLKKAKAGYILHTFAERGLYIPEHYQPFLDRFRGLEDPEFISDDMKTWIYKTTRKYPSEIEPSDVAKAHEDMRADHLILTANEAYWRRKGTTKAEYEDEMLKPISAEDRAEQGIGSIVKTYQQLVDEGKRFATDADRKMYQELYTARERLVGMKELFFGTEEKPESGIFIGIGKAAPARVAARGKLTWEKLNGTQRGRNTEEFNDYKKYFARSLIKIAGEQGSRLSDQDINGIVTVMPDTGTGLAGVPDSELLAKSKFDRAVLDMARLMKLLEDTTTVVPIGQPTAPSAPSDADAAADALIKEHQEREK